MGCPNDPSSASTNATHDLDADRTLAAPTNAKAGHSGQLWITQKASWDLTLDAAYTVVGDADITGQDAETEILYSWTTNDGASFQVVITPFPNPQT